MANFGVTGLPFRITEGDNFSFMLVPSSALGAGVTVRWEVILDGQLAASPGFFPSLSGTVDFDAGATDAQRVNIAINDDGNRSEDRNFSVRLIEVAGDGTETQIGDNHAVTLIDDDTAKSFAHIIVSNSVEHDTLVFGSSYTYNTVSGAAGADTFIITRHQRGNLSIDDALGSNVIKFDEGVSITAVQLGGFRTVITNMTITLGTGAEISIVSPRSAFSYQLGDGVLMDYTAFLDEVVGVALDLNVKTQLATPYAITDEPDTPSSNGGRNSQFTIPNLQDTITEGNNFSFMLTPSSALDAGVTVRWEVILDGQLAASSGFFPSLSGTVTFGEGAITGQTVTIAINDDPFISEDRNFSVRLIEVAGDGTETRIGEDHAVILIDDDTSKSFANIVLPSTGDHDTFVFGSSYTYRSASGGAGDDTYIVTRHQRGDVSIDDALGSNVIKFEEGVSITAVQLGGFRTFITNMTITLGTGAEISIASPRTAISYQLGDGVLMDYTAFLDEVVGVALDLNVKTQLATPYAITDEPDELDTPSSNGGGNSQFTIPNLQDTITEGNDFSFMLTPSSALDAGVTVRWEVILDGQLAASSGFFPSLSGTVDFDAGATDAQRVNIAINDDLFISEDRSFSVRLIEVAADGTKTQIGEDHAVTLIDDDTSRSFANIFIPTTGEHDTLVFGSSYTYRSVVGAAGDDTFIITRHQRGDLSINDLDGEHIIKFDEGVEITHVEQEFRIVFGGRQVISEVSLTLDTGAVITVQSPTTITNSRHVYRYQLGDGEAQLYADFHAELIAGGFKAGSTTQLATPYVITDEQDTPSSNGGGNSQFTIPNVQDTITEGNDFSFMLTPSSALDAGGTVRWEVILDGQLAASPGFFPSLSGTVDFDAGATDAQRVNIAINDDGDRSEDRSFSVRLIEVAADGTKTQIGEDHAVTLIDDDTSRSFANIFIPNTSDHDTLVFGSSYTYRSVSGAGGNDTFIITRHQRGDLSINDLNGEHIIKFDEGVEITHVNQIFRTVFGGRMVVSEVALTLDTGAVITVDEPASTTSNIHRYRYQLGDGEAQIYADFYAELIAGGFEAGSDTQLATPYAITGGPNALPNNGGRDKFTVTNLQDTITEGDDFSFMLTPSSALDAGVTVRWEIVLDGKLPASPGFFPLLSGTVTFGEGAITGQTVNIATNDDPFISEDRNFSVRLIEVAADGTKTQIGEDHAVTLIDDDTSKSFANIFIPNSGEHDTFVLGSSYTYRSVEGLAGDDTFIITRHQRGDLSINDQDGEHIIKFDEDVEITHVKQTIQARFGNNVVTKVALTLDTGAVITVRSPTSVDENGRHVYRYQLGDGEAQIYADFYAELIAGGFEAGSTTQLATPYAITDEQDTPSRDGGGNSQFTIPNLQNTIIEGNNFSFMLTPSSALDAGVTVRWEVILDGQLAASPGFFPALSGTVTFQAGARAGQTITIAINDDLFISEDRNFSVRLIEVAADGRETQIGEDHAVTLIDDDTSKSFANVLISNTGDHDTLVFGSSYTYPSVEGAGGDDTFIITRHQRGDLSINDALGEHIIKFDEGVEITHVDQSIVTIRGRQVTQEIALTLDTGGVITVRAPASVAVSGAPRYRYQLGDGEAQIYADFYAEITAGGFEAGSTTQLATPVIAGGLNALPNNGGRDKFIVTNLQDTVEEGDDFSFMLTPSSALDAGVTVRWEVILDGQLAASSGFFPSLSGTVDFDAGATDAQRVNIAINDDLFISEDRNFSVRLIEVAADGTKTQIGEDHAVTLIDDDTSKSFANVSIYNTGDHDTLVFGSSYTYRSVSGAAGDDTFIITRHQRGDLSINDPDGQHIIKFDEGLEITHVDQSIRTIRNRMVIDEIALTLDTGGVITVEIPASVASGVHRYRYQLGDGEAQIYADFYAELIAGGFEAGSTTQLATPYAITDEPDTPSSDGGGNSQFTIPNLQDTITEGNDFSFMLTPSSALGAGVTVRWEVILDGQLAASAGFFPALSGTVTFQAGARTGQTITIAINDDGGRSEDRNFSVRLIEVAGDGTKTQIGEDHAVTLIDDDTSKSFANVSIYNTGDHDTLVFGSSYTYRSVEGLAGDDTFIITRHQRGDLSINDSDGQHIIKFDEGVEITHVDQSIRTIRNRMVIDEIALTLDTGGVITVEIPASVTNGVHRYRYQLGDGEAQIYADFYANLIAGGFEAGSTTQLATPVIAGGPNALPNNGGRDKFTVTNLQDTITEGNDFSFMLTPSSALDAGVTVRWEIVLDGKLPASPGFFPLLSGTVTFGEGAITGQTVNIATNDDPFISEDRNFSVRLIEVAGDGTKTQIGEDHAVTLIDDDTSKSFANIFLPSTAGHDTFTLGSSYTYNNVSGAGGDDTFIITRHQRGDLPIDDENGGHIIKFDEGVEITHVNQIFRTVFGGRMVVSEVVLTLDTGAVVTVTSPTIIVNGINRYRYQLGDGEAQLYADFYAELIAGGFEDGSTTQLATPYAITDEPDTPSSNGGGNSQFTIPNLQDTITEGNDFGFMLTPSSALDAGVTVRWEVILDGQLAASARFFPSLSGAVDFDAGATDAQRVNIAINDDGDRSEDRNFSVRLIEVAGDGTKTQIGEDHAVTLIDNDTSRSFANIFIPNTGGHDTLVFGSSYTYRSVTGAAGDDIFIITRHQRGDLSIHDPDGQHIIKFDEGVEITHVDQSIRTIRNRMVTDEIALILDTGAVITVRSPASITNDIHRYRYQLGDGEAQLYADFYAELIAGGFEAGSTTQLATPVIAGGPNALPNNGGRDKFTVTNLQDTVEEGDDFSFMLTLSSALDAGVTVRWEVILDGQLAATRDFFAALSGRVTFDAGATDGQTVTIATNDDPYISEDRNFSVRLIEVAADGTETQIGEDHAAILIDNDGTTRSFAHITLSSSGEHDTLVFGSSYTYRPASGAAGDDTFIITKYQRGDLSLGDPFGSNVIKFDEGSSITAVELKGFLTVITDMIVTLGTGAEISIGSPRAAFSYQLGDGVLMDHAAFLDEVVGVALVTNVKTQLATPYAITDEPDTPSSDGGGNSQFTIPNVQDTITEGNDFSFMLTPSLALDAGVTVRWEVILDGQLAASPGFFPSLSGTVNFDAGATDAQRVNIAINDDLFISEDRSFSVRLIEVAGDGTKTQIGEDHAVTLIDDDTTRSFSTITLAASGEHDTLVFGSSYTYRPASGGAGDDTFIITKHQRGNLSLVDGFGSNVIKFDEGSSITAVELKGFGRFISSMTITLGTGAEISIASPRAAFSYQLGDGVLMDYTAFLDEVVGVALDLNVKTQLATPYAITDEPDELDTPSSNGGGNSQFTIPDLQDTITEGNDFSFMLTPSLALGAGVTVRWEVILDGQLAASPGFFPSLSGTVNFEAGATDAQRVNIAINDDLFISEDRNFSVRLIEVAGDGTETQIGDNHAVTLIDDDTTKSFARISLSNSSEHDTLVLGSSYTYGTVSGAAGNDTFIITKYQRGDLSISDPLGSNVIKFEEGVSITAIQLTGFSTFISNMTITLGTGAEISIASPRAAFSYQLGDGVLMDYAAFLDEVVGVALVTNVKTQLATPYAITDEPDTPSSNGGGNSQFTIPDLQDTITEGNDFSFMLTPSLALGAGVTVRWEVILDGQLAASPGFFPSLSGTVNFEAGATDAQRVNIAINDDLFISEDRNFSVRLIEVAGDGTETQIGDNHAVTLIDDDTTKSFARISLSNSSEHDTLVLGSSYTYGTVSGAAGNDTFIITKYQRGDLSISDPLGSNVIKFEEGVSITAIQLTGFSTFISNMTITLGTGAEISIASPRAAFSYQLGDGVLMDYTAFLDEVVGVALVANVKTELATPYAITDEPELPAVVNFALEQERLIEEGYYHISVTGQINVNSEGPVNTPIAVTYTVDGDTDGDNSVTVNNVRFTIENDGSWIAEVVADLGVASGRDTIRTFTVRADDGDARTATAEIDVRTKFNGMTILDANADASAFASTLTGQIDQIYIGSRGADGRDANGQPDPVLTHGGRDVIIGLEGDDAFQLGHNQEDTIYQRFSSSGSNWYNNDGADTYTNYVRATANAPDKFVFVDIDGTVVNKADFVAHTSVQLFADVTVNSGVITITGFEIRFLNPDSSVQSTISIDYSTVFQPIATNPADFGLAGITTSRTHMVTINTEAVWNRYFGEGAEAFQVIGNDDLPPIITELVPDAAPVPGAPTAITADTATVVYDGDVPPAGMTVARLTTTDIDAGDTHIYAITGGTHASSFSISGNELQFAAQNAVNRDLMEMWSVQVTSTDSRGLMVEKTFTFTRGVALNVVTEESAPKADALTLGGIIFTSASEGDGAAAGDDGIPQINVEIVVSDAVNGRSVSAGTPEFAISDTTADVITLTITIAQTGDTPWSAIGNLIEDSLPDAVGVISFDSINSATTNIDKRGIENGGAIGTHTLSGGEGVPDALNIGGLLITARQAGESGMDGTPQLNFTLVYEADRGDIVLKDLFLPSDHGGNGEPIIIVTAGPSATWADIAAAINADSDASSYVNVRATDPTGLFTAADATVPPAGALHKLVLGPNDDLTITRNADAAELPIISLGFGSFSDYIYLNTDDLEGGTAPISISLASDVPEEGAGVRTWADFATFINNHVGVERVESRASTYITATSSSNAIIARESFNSFASVPVITTVPLTGGANVESVELPTGTALLSANFNPQAAGNADNDELGTTASRGWAVRNLDPEVPEDIPLTPDMKDIGPLRVIAVNEGLSSVPNDGIPVITFGINFNQAVTAEEGARVKVLPTADGNYLVSIQLHQFTQQQRDAGMGTTWNDIRDVISTDMGTEDAPGAARLIRTEAIGTDAELNTMITRIPAGTTGVLGLPAEGGTLGAGLPEVVEVLLTPDITDVGPLRIISVNEGLSSVPNDGIPVITFAIDFDQVVTAEEETRVNVLPSTSGNYTVFIQLHRFTQQQQDAGMGTTWNDIRDVISADMGTEDAPGAARLIRTEAIGTDAELNTIITIIPTRDLTPGAGLPEVASTADSLLVGANGELRITSRVEGDNTAPGVPAIQFSLTVNGSPGSELIILTGDTDPELQTINITIARDNTETDWDGIVALIEGSDVANRLVSVELTGDFGDQVIEAEDETSSTTVMLAGGNNAQDYVPAVEGAPAVLAVMAADEEITTINKDAVGLLIGTLSDGERSTRFEILYNEDDPSQNDEDERVFVVDNDDQLYYIGGDTGDAGDEYTLTVRAYDGPTPDDFTQEYEYVVSVGPDMTDGADAAPPVADGKARFEVTSSGNINAAVVGDVLMVSRITSDPNGDGTLGYQWQRDGTDISDGTGGSASYTIVAADVGTPLAVAVNYIDGGNTHELVIAPGVAAPALFEVPDTEIEGTAGDDRGVTSLTGTGNAELIQGGSGNDNIVPGGGGDVVIGGYGDDNIVLGAGDATVIYRFESDAQADGAWRATDGADQIFNFQHGVDKLILVDVSSDNPVNDLAGFIADSGQPDVSLAILGTGRNNSDGVEIRAVFSLFITFDLAGVAGGRGLTIGFNESTRPIIDPLDEASVDHYISGTSLTSYEFLDDLLGTTETFTALEMVKEIDLPSDLIIL